MQTFLPYPDYAKTASVLDRQRLGKQRVENLQILKALLGQSKGWTNHPATRMWRNHIHSLTLYHEAIVNEWVGRGYKDTTLDSFHTLIQVITDMGEWPSHIGVPAWLGDERLHSSHRANLLRKDAAFYGTHGWTEDPQTGYWWPV